MADELTGVEADILANHIEPFVAGDDAAQTNTVTTEANNAATETTEEGNVEDVTQQQQADQQDKPGTGEGGAANANQQQQQKLEGQNNRSARTDGAIEDGKGNLTLPSGEIIKAGSHRRLYEDNQKFKGQVEQLGTILQRVQNEIAPSYERQIEQLSARVQAFEQANVAYTQYGLAPEEQTQAVKLAAAWKANPVATVQYLIAEAKAMGHNIEGIGSSVDTMALQRMLDQRLAPLTANHEQSRREQEILEQSNNAATQFFTKFPDAKIHEQLIAKLVSENNLSPESAYYELRLSAQGRGLDWNQPLLPQLHAKASQQSAQQQQQQTQPVVPQQQTLPNGRVNAGNVATNAHQVAHESTSMGDIVRDAMRAAGMKI